MRSGPDPALCGQVRRWCFDTALPFWFAHGLDRTHGGAVEALALALDGAGAAPAPVKRVRVLARQLYVFSHAALLGWPGGREASDHLAAALMSQAWMGPDAGWARRLTPAGAVQDPTPDLYDYAFALFALGWRYTLAREAETLALAHHTLDLIQTRFRHPQGGYHHALPPEGPRQQNPHMHLLEAALVWLEVGGGDRFAALAQELAALFRSRLLHPEGVLREVFASDWSVLAQESGRRLEPGHAFEWAWLLAQHQRLTGAGWEPEVRALVARAERWGVDPGDGRTLNAVRDDGVVLDGGSRAWPNTERIKGWLGLHAVTGRPAWPAVEASVRLLLGRYLGPPAPPGGWIDAFDAHGRAVSLDMPASTLYHLFLAFTEYLRVAEQPAAQGG